MARRGVTTEAVVEAAAGLADAGGLEHLTLVRLAAALGIQPSSLFNHIAGLAQLRRLLQLRGLREMTALVGRAAVGRAGEDAVLATAVAMRTFARAHPGLYAASLPAPTQDAAHDPELNAAATEFVGIFFDAMRQYGYEGEEAVHVVRGLFSAVHGFIMLERAGTFGMPVDPDASFQWLIRRYIAALRPPHAQE